MTTYSAFRDRVENAVNDASNATFSTTVIEEWIEDAIREYSQHFPRRLVDDITTSANTREYDLDLDVQDIISVEYPQGEDPPEYLIQRPYTHPDFWLEDGYYDYTHYQDLNEKAKIFISEKPDAGETIRVTATATHDENFVAGNVMTVPEFHEPILVKYCVWQAIKYLEQAEEQDPTSNSSLLMAQMAQNAYRAERAYYNALRKALASQRGRSQVARWKLDKHDRIY